MRPPEHTAHRHSPESGLAQNEAVNLLGDFSAFLQQVGVRGLSVEFVPSAPAAAALAITEISALRTFLDTYAAQVLVPIELPSIFKACNHVRRGECRELVALDVELAAEQRLAPFAPASKHVGVSQLLRLKPLRDERTVQRYLIAVKTGQASGWHTLVYGLTLAVYSLPLRQGLLHYGRETLSALARAAAGTERYLAPDCQEMLGAILDRLPEAVERAVATDDGLIVPLQKYL